MAGTFEQLEDHLVFPQRLPQPGGELDGLLHRHDLVVRPVLDEEGRRVGTDVGFRVGRSAPAPGFR